MRVQTLAFFISLILNCSNSEHLNKCHLLQTILTLPI